jgi:hypothetical protein
MQQTNSATEVQHKVKFAGRDTTIYSEGPRSVALNVEYLGDHAILVHLKDVTHWNSPGQPLPVTPQDIERIRVNVRKAYAAERMMAQFDDEPGSAA